MALDAFYGLTLTNFNFTFLCQMISLFYHFFQPFRMLKINTEHKTCFRCVCLFFLILPNCLCTHQVRSAEELTSLGGKPSTNK